MNVKPFADVITKAAFFILLAYFKTLSVSPVWGSDGTGSGPSLCSFRLTLPELNKYLKHHGLLKQDQKSSKNAKVKTIMGHFARMNTLRTGQAKVGGSNESGKLDNSGESSEGGETDDEYKSDAPDSKDDSNNVVLAFISDEEYADERPATTRSG